MVADVKKLIRCCYAGNRPKNGADGPIVWTPGPALAIPILHG